MTLHKQDLGDCDLCFDFAHFIVKLYNTWQKKKLTKTGYLVIIWHRYFTVWRVNFITAPAEFRRCHFRFCDLFVERKRTITKLNVAKIPKMFVADRNFLYSIFTVQNKCCFHVVNMLFSSDRPGNFLLLFLKTVSINIYLLLHQYLFLHKAS